MLVLGSIYFKNIRSDPMLSDFKYSIMYLSILTSVYMLAHKLEHSRIGFGAAHGGDFTRHGGQTHHAARIK